LLLEKVSGNLMLFDDKSEVNRMMQAEFIPSISYYMIDYLFKKKFIKILIEKERNKKFN
jgi:hypothetical protein